MGKGTGIQWCDDTVNPTTGCDGCELWPGSCYAGHQHEGRMAVVLPKLYAKDFTEVRLAPGRMAKAASAGDLTGKARPGKPWLDGMPRMIFVGDMGDIFSKAVPFEYLADEIMGAALSRQGRRHVWMWLTKRPSRMAEFARWLQAERGVDWPVNVWAGTSVTTRASLKRIEQLLEVPSKVRFVSAEPLREAIDLGRYLPRRDDANAMFLTAAGHDPIHWGIRSPSNPGLDLIIVGGESDQGEHRAHPFYLEWARSLISQCKAAGAACFVKQFGSRPVREGACRGNAAHEGPGTHREMTEMNLKDHHGGDWDEWPADVRVREFPQPLPAEAAR